MNEYGRAAQERRHYEKLLYPGTEVLKNKLDIRDAKKLERAERYHAHENLRNGLPPEAKEQSPSALKAIHRTMLHSVYEWAGEFRNYPTGRGTPFARPDFIEPALNSLFQNLKRDNNLLGLNADKFAAGAASYVNEINAVHPFVDGNGRMQRIWLRNIGEQAGYNVRLLPGDRDAWYRASAEGFHRSNDMMAEFIASRISPINRDRENSTKSPEVKSDSDKLKDRLRSLTQRTPGKGDRDRDR